MKIYNLGSLNIDYVYAVDHFVFSGETLSSKSLNIFPGGKGLNQSVALARAGVRVIHGAVVGDDGELLLSTLGDAGADTTRIKRGEGKSGHAIIQVNGEGQNCILLFAGTNHCITEDYIEEFLADAQQDDILLLQNEVNNIDLIFNIANKKGMQIAFNPSPFDEKIKELPLSYVKWWFCNEIECEALFGSNNPEEMVAIFRESYPQSNLILTLGENGSVFINAQKCVKQPIYKVRAVDTTAAGDTFTGYFIAAVAEGKGEEYALTLAAKASAITVSKSGASTSIPTLDEVLAF